MTVVLVKHHPWQKKEYAFALPECLEPYTDEHSKVTCKTSTGKSYGVVTAILENPSAERLKEISGADYDTLRQIVAVQTDYPMDRIHISSSFKRTKPNSQKIVQRITEWYKSQTFNTNVVISKDGDLIDGYTAYLVSKMFGCNTLHGEVVSE